MEFFLNRTKRNRFYFLPGFVEKHLKEPDLDIFFPGLTSNESII